MKVLAFDTSNYTTSVAVFDGNGGKNASRLLDVAPGALGLRQSDALFAHVKRLPELADRLFCDMGAVTLDAVGASTRPRAVEGSYMPCFLAGWSQASCLAQILGVPLYEFSHQQGHIAAAALSAAPDYFPVAAGAIREMFRQTGPYVMEDGLLRRGVVIRELVLPGDPYSTRRVIDWVGQTFAPGQVLFSLMSQYTPVGDLAQWPELQHPISPELNEEMYQYLIDSPITDGFYQDLDAATGDMIPAFDGTGV